MATATWRGAIIAQSDTFEIVEGNVYFPPESVNKDFIQPSSTHTVCGWKGTASYYDVVVNGQRNPDAAWYYPTPLDAAKQLAGYIAFWRGVTVVR
jgi:uncharacterized protein (DUF427 family)